MFWSLGALQSVNTDGVPLPVLLHPLQGQAVEHTPGAGLLDDGAPEH